MVQDVVQDVKVSDTNLANHERGTVWAFQKGFVSQTRECKHCSAAVSEKYGGFMVTKPSAV